MPVYNSEAYLAEAIESVLNQEYQEFELIAINDGSTDNSLDVINEFNIPQIKIIDQPHRGVSCARNNGLAKMNGDFFCFLDSDDILPRNSLQSRINKFQSDESIEFIDGKVLSISQDLSTIEGSWIPQLTGCPFNDLLHLTGKSFFGITWMFRRINGREYWFNEELTHGEDLFFYLMQSKYGGKYDYVEDEIYYRRKRSASAMSDINKLAEGYDQIFKFLSSLDIDKSHLESYKSKSRSIVLKSFLGHGRIRSALRYLIK